MSDPRFFTFHIQPYDEATFDLERHRLVAAFYLTNTAMSAEQAKGIISDPVIVPRRYSGADITYWLIDQ